MAPLREDDQFRTPFPFTAPLAPLATSPDDPGAPPTPPRPLSSAVWAPNPDHAQSPTDESTTASTAASTAALGARRGGASFAQTEPVAGASAALAQLIAQMAQQIPQWDADAIADTCAQLRRHGAPLAPNLAFHGDTRLMLRMSHAIEDTVIARRLPCEFYVGFQRLSLMNAQVRRYTQLLTKPTLSTPTG